MNNGQQYPAPQFGENIPVDGNTQQERATMSVPHPVQGQPVQAPPVAPQAVPNYPQTAPSYPWQGQFGVSKVEMDTEPLAFHRLYLGVTGYSWWKPLTVFLLMFIYYLVIAVAIGLIVGVLFAVADVRNQGSLGRMLSELASLDTQKPASVVVGLASVVLLIPALWLACLSVKIPGFRRGMSVALKLRWGFLGQSLLIAAVLYSLSFLTTLLIAIVSGKGVDFAPGLDMNKALLSGVFLVLLLPFQCFAEEYFFRAGLLQVFGSWIKHPLAPILISSIIFALMHPYGLLGKAIVCIMGCTMGYMAWRTGGLEAGIAMHLVNNTFAFVPLLFGFDGQTTQVPKGDEIEIVAVIADVLVMLVYALCIDFLYRRQAKRGKIMRLRVDRVLRDMQLVPNPNFAPSAVQPVAPVQFAQQGSFMQPQQPGFVAPQADTGSQYPQVPNFSQPQAPYQHAPNQQQPGFAVQPQVPQVSGEQSQIPQPQYGEMADQVERAPENGQ